jgi:hypothetical protein
MVTTTTVKDLIRSARTGCDLCNLIFAKIDGDGRPERTSLTGNFQIELKLKPLPETVHVGAEVLGPLPRAIECRGYSYCSLVITLSGQYAEQNLDSAPPTEKQEQESSLATTRMSSSPHKTTSSSKDLARS